MAKPVLFYALVSGYHPHGHGFRIIGVTLEKGRQVYGREVETDAATHCSDRTVLHRFASGHSLEFVKAAHDRAARMRERLAGSVHAAEENARSLRREMDRQILEAAKGKA